MGGHATRSQVVVPNNSSDEHGRNPFFSEAVIPAEVNTYQSHQMENYKDETNEQAMACAQLDLIEERRLSADTKNAINKQRVERYYNKQVKLREFRASDLVLRKVFGKPP
ncbi:hypothetical protein ACS0TY_021187 [Phlomoides rotata]